LEYHQNWLVFHCRFPFLPGRFPIARHTLHRLFQMGRGETAYRSTNSVPLCRSKSAMVLGRSPFMANLEAKVCHRMCHVTPSRLVFLNAGRKLQP